LAQVLPVLLFALPAGHVADRFDSQKVLIAAQALALVTSLGLAALSFWQGPVPLIFLCLLMVGVARAFNVPARWALLPRVVSAELVPNAVTWNSSGFFVARAAGPPLGGLILGLTTPAASYVLTALCILCCVGFIATLRPQKIAQDKEAPSLQTLLAGMRFVWQTKPILATISLDLFAVLLGGATALYPIFAEEILRVGPWGLGLLRAAPAVGALVMALFMAHHPPLHHAGKTLLAAVAGFGVATILFGLSENFPLSLGMLLLTGALDNISVVVRGTLIQTLTPEAMRGRVGSVHFVFVSSSNELGEFESGVTAYYFGAVASVVMGGIGTVLVVLAVMALWPAILRLSLARPALTDQATVTASEESLAPPL
jgi:MFS family permease